MRENSRGLPATSIRHFWEMEPVDLLLAMGTVDPVTSAHKDQPRLPQLTRTHTYIQMGEWAWNGSVEGPYAQ
jgi:hypothetical protein